MTMKWVGPRTRSISVVLICAVVLVSCTSMRVVRPDELQTGLKAGDTVKIITKDGRTLELTIVTITPEALVGQDQRVEFADIGRLEKREISTGKTVGLVAGIAAVVALVLLVAAAAAAGPGFAAAH